MEITPSKLLALGIAIIFAVFVAYAGPDDPIENSIRAAMWLLLPLLLIWFPDEFGSVKGYVGRGGYINRETPGCMVSATGWLFLIGLPLYAWFCG